MKSSEKFIQTITMIISLTAIGAIALAVTMLTSPVLNGEQSKTIRTTTSSTL